MGCIDPDNQDPVIWEPVDNWYELMSFKFGHTFDYEQILMGGCSIDATGVPLTDEAIATAKSDDAVLMGSIGGDAKTSPWYKLRAIQRPEAGLLQIRKALNLFANLRPAVSL